MAATKYFHEGEAAIQAEAGVDTAAFEAMAARSMLPNLNVQEAHFVNERTFSVATTIDSSGRPWSSPLFGSVVQPLFAVQDQVTVTVFPQQPSGDPLIENIAATSYLGMLYFDPSYRRRMKSIGSAEVHGDALNYRMHRNFGICNKYIYKRGHTPSSISQPPAVEPRSSTRLDGESIAQLTSSDTMFLASYHDVNGADATHRGGPSGFVTVLDPNTISIPDYMGNGMFNTLGNLRVDDRVGFMTVDFSSGRTVQLTGQATVQPSPEDDVMSERTLILNIDDVVVTRANQGNWVDVEEFPIRPGMINPATPYLRQ